MPVTPGKITQGRYALLAILSLFSLIILGLSAATLQTFSNDIFLPAFSEFPLGVSIVTLVVIGISLGVEYFRKGAFTSWVVVEIIWTFLLMVFWLAVAGDITVLQAGLACFFVPVTDSFGDISGTDSSTVAPCHEAQAMIAFAWLNWLMLLAWFIALLAFAAVSHTRGNRTVWTSPVNGTDFYARKNPQVPPTSVIVTQVQPGYQPQQFAGQYPPGSAIPVSQGIQV